MVRGFTFPGPFARLGFRLSGLQVLAFLGLRVLGLKGYSGLKYYVTTFFGAFGGKIFDDPKNMSPTSLIEPQIPPKQN